MGQSVQSRLLIPIIITGLILLGLSAFVLLEVRERNVTEAGVTAGKALADQVTTLRTVYTKEIVGRAKQAGMDVNYDFDKRLNTIPLPATMVKFLGEQIEKYNPGSKIRLYSRYPFPHRAKTEGPIRFHTS